MSDFVAKELAKTFSQAMHGHASSAGIHLKFRGQLCVGDPSALGSKETFHFIEFCLLAGFDIFLSQVRHRLLQQGQGPAALVGFVRLGCGLDLVARLCCRSIEGQMNFPTAAFLSAGAVPFIG